MKQEEDAENNKMCQLDFLLAFYPLSTRMLTDFRALSFERNRLVVLIAQVSIKECRPAVNPGKELGLRLHCSQKKEGWTVG